MDRSSAFHLFLIGAIIIVHWGQRNFVPSETHPMSGFEFQAVSLLLALYLVVTGNRGPAATEVKSTQADQSPASASAVVN